LPASCWRCEQVAGARSGGEDTERKPAYARRARAAAPRVRPRALTAGGALAPSAVSGAAPKTALRLPLRIEHSTGTPFTTPNLSSKSFGK